MLSQFVRKKTRNILFLTSFREEENVMLHYFHSIKNLNPIIQKLKNDEFLYNLWNIE